MTNFFDVLFSKAGDFLAAHGYAIAGGAAVLVLLLLLGMNVIPTCYLKFVRNNEIKDGKKSVMLTFDDGPDPQYTVPLLDLLKKNDVKATFFLLAEKAERYPEIVDRMLMEGHQIGFHALDHRNLWWMSPDKTRRNFQKGLSILHRQGWEVQWYRPPFGNITPWAFAEMRENGLELHLWTVMAQDWRADHSAEVILGKLRKRVRAGSIICLHDSGEGSAAPGQPAQTIRALETFLPEMKEKGYQFVQPQKKDPSEDGKTVYQNALKLKRTENAQ